MIDALKGAGFIGLIILTILAVIFLILCPIFVSIVLTNLIASCLISYGISISGLSWYAFVIVIWAIIVGILSKLRSDG